MRDGSAWAGAGHCGPEKEVESRCFGEVESKGIDDQMWLSGLLS